MQRTKPPFSADMVGSLLRTAPIKQARAQREKGAITAAQLKEVEDREIEKIIKKQEEIGLKLATDGEFRRSWWHFDFFSMLDGVELYELDHGIQFQGVQTKMQSIRVKGKIGFSNHPMIEHFKFLKAHTKVTPKMTIPAPSVMHFRLEPKAVATDVYKDRDAIFGDLAMAYQKAIKAFYDAGCRYLQFDDTAWAYLCSQEELKKARDRGLDVDHLQETYTACINKALEAKPADMTITTHVCRGNFRSTFISSGGYEPVAQNLLGQVQLRRLFPRIRHRPRRRLRAAALFAEGQQDRRARSGYVQERTAGAARGHQAAHPGSDQVRRARSALSVAAMRLRLDRGGQYPGRGRAMGEAQDDRGAGRRGLGQISCECAATLAWRGGSARAARRGGVSGGAEKFTPSRPPLLRRGGRPAPSRGR